MKTVLEHLIYEFVTFYWNFPPYNVDSREKAWYLEGRYVNILFLPQSSLNFELIH